MPSKVDYRVFTTPTSKDEIMQAFDFTPKSQEDKTLFVVLEKLLGCQEHFDEQLATLPASTLDHGKRYAVRMQGHVTFNKDTKKWTVFNGRYHQEAPKWFLIKGVDIVSKGLARESQLVGQKSQRNMESLCKALDIKPTTLKGKSRKDKVETVRKELFKQLVDSKITPEQFAELLQRLEATEGLNTEAGALLLESHRVRDGKNPIQVLEQAACEYGVEHCATDYDADGLLKVCLNGTLDLRYLDTPEKLLRPSRPEDLNTMCMNVFYDPSAVAPTVEKQLRWVFVQPGIEGNVQEEAEILKYARMILGGILDTTRTKGTFLIVSGIAGSGKSILLNSLGDILGTYTTYVDGSFFLDNPNRGKGDASPHMAKVVNKALVIATEVKNAATCQMDEVLIKNWTGGDNLTYRPLYDRDEKTFKPNAQLVMSTNELPKLSGDKAVGDRHRLAVHHCSRAVPPEMRRDEDTLRAELLAEGSGFLNILLKGLQERNAIEGRIKPPASIVENTQEYITSQDEVALFFESEGIKADPQNRTQGVSSSALYAMYQQFKGGATADMLASNLFAAKLKGRGFRCKHTMNGNFWIGIHAPEGKKPQTKGNTTKEGVRLPDKPASNGHIHTTLSELDKELSSIDGL